MMSVTSVAYAPAGGGTARRNSSGASTWGPGVAARAGVGVTVGVRVGVGVTVGDGVFEGVSVVLAVGDGDGVVVTVGVGGQVELAPGLVAVGGTLPPGGSARAVCTGPSVRSLPAPQAAFQ